MRRLGWVLLFIPKLVMLKQNPVESNRERERERERELSTQTAWTSLPVRVDVRTIECSKNMRWNCSETNVEENQMAEWF